MKTIAFLGLAYFLFLAIQLVNFEASCITKKYKLKNAERGCIKWQGKKENPLC
jgi:hypothetical protein